MPQMLPRAISKVYTKERKFRQKARRHLTERFYRYEDLYGESHKVLERVLVARATL